MQSSRKARWQQATALVSLSTCGAMTGFSLAHSSVADLTSPSGIPVKLMALNKAAKPASASDSALRSAIVKSARHYLKLAQSRSPSAMESLIWQNDSMDGADHGQSCAAFASLTLESGAQATGLQSWVSGGSTYPWAVHPWVDARVDPNPGSMGVVSVVQDAQAHHRWHPIGDGYIPKPGDWVLFDGHVEVVTKYASGVLSTIGGDSMPNLSVNAHQYANPLSAQGVTGFVNNGVLLSAVSQTSGGSQGPASGGSQGQASGGSQGQASGGFQSPDEQGQADVPGIVMPTLSLGSAAGQAGSALGGGSAVGAGVASGGRAASGAAGATAADSAVTAKAIIPGAVPLTGSVTSYSSAGSSAGHGHSASSSRYSRSQAAPSAAASSASALDTAARQEFIAKIAPGALAAQRQYGVPAAVTIAQAIDESGWGQSLLATQDKNLFGIKGTGPAGSVVRATQEVQNGQAVTINAPFRVYASMAQSISDHGLLLATGSSYKQAMADRRSPDAFANDLTGVYATDPNYGASLITIMRQYNLYRYDAGAPAAGSSATAASGAGGHGGSSGQSGSAAGQSGSAGRRVSSGTGGSSAQPASAGQGGSAGQGASAGQGGSAGQGASAGQEGGAQIPGLAQVGAAGLGLAPVRGVGSGATPSHGTAGHGTAGSGTVTRGTAGSGTVTRGHPARRAAGGGTAGSGAVGSGAVGSGSVGSGSVGSGEASIPGLDDYAGTGATEATTSAHLEPMGALALRAGPRNLHVSTRRYVPQMPRVVLTDFVTTAKIPLLRAKPVYQQVAEGHGMRWELLAACDWMQCQAQPGVSPVYGENLGTKNPDGTIYRTKADALEQCAADLIELAALVYGVNLRQRRLLSVRELANVFAAFRWGGLLKAHRISAMDFPYSVEGLTAGHTKMRWPEIRGDAPDKPGTRFRMSFGAVPVVLRLNYPAVA